MVAFNRQSVASEGDITTYMNHWANHSDMVRKFKLYKDIVRWGVYDPVSSGSGRAGQGRSGLGGGGRPMPRDNICKSLLPILSNSVCACITQMHVSCMQLEARACQIAPDHLFHHCLPLGLRGLPRRSRNLAVACRNTTGWAT